MILELRQLDLGADERTVHAVFAYYKAGGTEAVMLDLPLERHEANELGVGYWYEIDFTPIPDPTETP